MKKIVGVIPFLVLLLTSLSACNSEKQNVPSTEGSVQTTEGNVQVTEDNRQLTESNAQADEQKFQEITLDSLCTQLNTQRQMELAQTLKHSIQDYGIVGKDEIVDFSNAEVQELVKRHSYKSEINVEEALEDIETLMKILKTSYAGYSYFGGDARFEEAKGKMITRVHEAYDQGPALTGYLLNIVLEELSFIEDSHFMIGKKNTTFRKKSMYYDSDKNDFYRDNQENQGEVESQGFYTVIDGEKWYLSTEDEKYLHLTVSDEGKLVYGIFALANEESGLQKQFQLESKSGNTDENDNENKTENKSQTVITISWCLADAGQTTNSQKVHASYEKDGVPVTALARMSLMAGDIAGTNEFIDEAKKLREEKVFVLDLRGNLGGIVNLNDFFLYNLTGSKCEFKLQTVKRYSAMNQYQEAMTLQAMGGQGASLGFPGVNFYQENKELVDSWSDKRVDLDQIELGETVTCDTQGKWTDYKNKIIVLIDHDVVSSGEYLLYQLATVNNVIIMGTNSCGELVTGDVNALCDVYLPNSGLAVNYGQMLAITDQVDGFDVNGWMPDIITRGDALEAAVALINNQKQ